MNGAVSTMNTSPGGTFTSWGTGGGGQASQAISAAAQSLGISPSQMQSQIASGGLSSDQMQALTARLGAMNLNSNDLASIGNALGLGSQQLSQIQQTIQASRQPAAPGMPPPQQQGSYFSQQPTVPTGLGAPPVVGALVAWPI